MPECRCRKCGKPFDAPLKAKHKLLCGDARNREDVERLLAGAKANVVITSPPYASQRKYDESSDFRPIPPDQYVEWFRDVAMNIAGVLLCSSPRPGTTPRTDQVESAGSRSIRHTFSGWHR